MSRIEDRIGRIIAPLMEERERMEREREQATARVQAIDADLRRINRVLRAAGAQEPAAKKIRPKKTVISDALLERVRDAVARQDGTTAEIAHASGLAESTVRAGVKVLREQGRIRKTGFANNGSQGRAAAMYAVMPDVE